MTAILPLILFAAPSGSGAADFSVTLAGGSAWSVPLHVTIRQGGFEELRRRVSPDTEPFRGAPYYAWRIGWWRGDAGWDVQLVHHKVVWTDPPPPVASFEITHGYNLLTLGHRRQRGAWTLRGAAGAVIAHPESVVRGRRFAESRGVFGTGYYVTGPVVSVGAARRLTSPKRLVFLAGEAEVSAARARVPVAGGDASAPNVALHLRLAAGIGR